MAMRGCRFNQQTDHKTLKGSNTREIRPIKPVRTATLRQRRGVHRNVHARYGENIGLYGTGNLFEEPNPTGSRPSELIGLCETTRETPPPQHTRKGKEDKDKETGPAGAREQLAWNFI